MLQNMYNFTLTVATFLQPKFINRPIGLFNKLYYMYLI